MHAGAQSGGGRRSKLHQFYNNLGGHLRYFLNVAGTPLVFYKHESSTIIVTFWAFARTNYFELKWSNLWFQCQKGHFKKLKAFCSNFVLSKHYTISYSFSTRTSSFHFNFIGFFKRILLYKQPLDYFSVFINKLMLLK